MNGSTAAKRTTLADLMAAAKIGAIDLDTEVLAATDVDAMRANDNSGGADAAQPTRIPLSASEHECGIPGCKHGAAHPAVSQPDRQVKLACPQCGAVARMTKRALDASGGIDCHGCAQPFQVAARRTYNRGA